MDQLDAGEAGGGRCNSPELTTWTHSLAGTLAKWAEQVIANGYLCLNAEYTQENNFSRF